ncbi:MAG: hypothetical protein A2527_13450 [Candidatus Lambdaproteobacteria bacterium RIFOXYD2_FULL_50_16]|uniref:Uncharacterized protein n=1 Tax=Candidatus Lambdaproteobacteria bacterium RIFOXYD2_FULL_50_16 TaxID=1817772 RepID=A0A1F6G570_9PROT|nr:MAG: hypothetical protein A2527_13450 [Candidatus Lambdaproteobacteria bacterium RIFOXYD2_FULL_50_16]
MININEKRKTSLNWIFLLFAIDPSWLNLKNFRIRLKFALMFLNPTCLSRSWRCFCFLDLRVII